MTRNCLYPTRLIGAVAALLFLASSAHAQDVHWHADYNTARKESLENQRPLVLDFGTDNCTWCRKLETTTFRDPGVVKLLRDRFVAVRIDANKEAGLTKALSVHAFPTLVFAAPDGKILGKHEGYMEANGFTLQLQQTLRDCGSNTPTVPPALGGARITFPGLQFVD